MNYTVEATWDSAANVWVAASSDVPGLVLENESSDVLIKEVLDTIPELLELAGVQVKDEKNTVTISFSKEFMFKNSKISETEANG